VKHHLRGKMVAQSEGDVKVGGAYDSEKGSKKFPTRGKSLDTTQKWNEEGEELFRGLPEEGEETTPGWETS